MPGAQPLAQSPFPTSPARNADVNSSARVGFAFGLSAVTDPNVTFTRGCAKQSSPRARAAGGKR